MLYLAQVILYTAAMLLIYFLFLRNKPLYQLSRCYLLASIFLPIVMPFIALPQAIGQRIQQAASFQVNLPAFVVNINSAGETGKYKAAIPAVWLAYGIIAALLLGWYVWNVLRLRRIIAANRKEQHSTYTLITSSGYGPGSFGRYIFFPGSEVNEAVLAHEQAHVRLHHTRDIVFVSIVQALLWPNILLLWIRRELKHIHEFQADADVNTDIDTYTQLLLSSVFNTHIIPVMHSFIIHPIKRRIMMLQKKGTASPVKAIILISASLVLFFSAAVGIQSCSKGADNSSGSADAPQVKKALLNPPANAASGTYKPDNNGVYSFAHKMPVPNYNYQSYLAENIHYPKSAKDNNIEGRVIIRFVVDENGNVKNAKCVKSVDNSLDNEALRVVSNMPAWTPGEENGRKVPVYYTMPIVFRLR